MKKNLMFAGLLLSMILVLGIVSVVSAVIITGDLTQYECINRGGTYNAATGNCNLPSGDNVIATGGDSGSRTSGTSSAKSAKKYSGWTPVEAADSNIGICYMKDVSSGRAKATAKIIGLFIKK